jgi:NAD(P)-dependent dehydrogenase (short-subunit alcohol dehydrogenase family)
MQKVWFLRSLLLGASVGTGLALREAIRRFQLASLRGRVVLITGASRGLGLALARECARQGAHLALCARQAETLEVARQQLAEYGVDVLAVPCDVGDEEQVQRFVAQTIAHFGHIDMLITNAGIITVGPQQAMTIADYASAMDSMFWGTVYPTLAVLPFMRAQKHGHIVHITSIGGKVSVPHLLPYNSAKFAALGFSEGLQAEVAREGIRVTSVVPGLMRTGSHINAHMKGNCQAEYTWFGTLATSPLTAISAASAARQIVRAATHGSTEIILTPYAQLVARFHGLLPGVTVRLLGLVNRLLPRVPGEGSAAAYGQESTSALTKRLTRPGEHAAQIYNQYTWHNEEEKAQPLR